MNDLDDLNSKYKSSVIIVMFEMIIYLIIKKLLP